MIASRELQHEAHAMETIRAGDRVRMRKPHPCGSDIWWVTRIGADVGLRCAGCDRRVMLTRSEFLKRLKEVLSPNPQEKSL